MHCNSCMPKPLEFEVMVNGDVNGRQLPSIRRYLEEIDMLAGFSDDRIIVREKAMKGLLDYMFQHMETDSIAFRIDNSDWKPIAEAGELIEVQWVDRIIDEETVEFHIQPIVDAAGETYAYEMLARFRGEAGELLSPFEVFEKAKLRNRLYALDRVCRVNAVRQAASLHAKVFINFIPTSIYSPEHCLRTTVQIANELGIDPSRFVFEVIETEQVKDMDHLKRILDYYREKGFGYALDDVGAGFNTVSMIRELEPFYTKLDRQYIQGIHADREKQKVAMEVLTATLSTGGIPLAEGIEEEVDFNWLKNAGFQLFQGYLFGKPTPIPVGEA